MTKEFVEENPLGISEEEAETLKGLELEGIDLYFVKEALKLREDFLKKTAEAKKMQALIKAREERARLKQQSELMEWLNYSEQAGQAQSNAGEANALENITLDDLGDLGDLDWQ